MVGNQAPSLDYIPATALCGAIAAALARKGKAARIPRLFGGPSPRWCPAWPCGSNDNETVIPMPLSYLHVKGDDGFKGKFGVINTLRTQRPLTTDNYIKLFGEDAPSEIPERLQWVKMAPGWLKFEVTKDVILEPGLIAPDLNNAMFHGADYLTRSARDGWLYSREYIAAYQQFLAYVVDANDAIQEEDKAITKIFVGKRITAGNGYATLAWEDVGKLYPPWATYAALDHKEVTIQIMSPAIIPGRQGGFLTGLDEKSWSEILDVDVEVKHAQSKTDPVHGWITVWDLPRERYAAVAAGSCYLLKLRDDDTKKLTKFHFALKGLVDKGLGIRTGEGFGWVSVSPPWLKGDHHKGNETGGNGFDPVGTVQQNDNMSQSSKRSFIEAAWKFAHTADVAPKANELAAIAHRVTDASSFYNYLNSLAQRKNPRKWDIVRKAWEENGHPLIDNDDPEAINYIRYFLSWAKTFADKHED